MTSNFNYSVYKFQDFTELNSSHENVSHVTLIDSDDAETYSNLLNKILNATKKFNVQFTTLVVDHPIDINKLYENYNTNFFLIFGINPLKLGLKMKHFKYIPITIKDRTFIFSDSLNTIAETATLKRKLWNALQETLKK